MIKDEGIVNGQDSDSLIILRRTGFDVFLFDAAVAPPRSAQLDNL